MAKLGDFLKSINKDKVDVFAEDPTAEKDYVPFVINKSLSYFGDTTHQANEMNMSHELPKRMQFDFLREMVRPGWRFKRWHKRENYEHIDIVKEYFGYSTPKAEQILDLLSKEDIQYIKNMMSKGGKTDD